MKLFIGVQGPGEAGKIDRTFQSFTVPTVRRNKKLSQNETFSRSPPLAKGGFPPSQACPFSFEIVSWWYAARERELIDSIVPPTTYKYIFTSKRSLKKGNSSAPFPEGEEGVLYLPWRAAEHRKT